MDHLYCFRYSNSTARQRARRNNEHQEDEIRIVIPYTKGMSEDIRRVCRGYGIKVVFRSAPTLRNKLTRVKDQLAVEKESAVVYKIPCSCGSFYIGETVRRLGTRVKEHREACIHGDTKKSAISEHAWTYQHPIMWTKAEVLDRACRHDVLRFKEAIHIQTSTGHFNRDVGVDIPECWPALLNLMNK